MMPVPIGVVPVQRRMMTSGWNSRMTWTISPRIFSRFHFCRVSSAVFEYPKSTADGKVLLGAIDLPGCEELLSPDHAEKRSLFGTDDVLPSFASGEAQVSGSKPPAKRQIGKKIVAFIVRMGGDQKNAAGVGQALERELRIGGRWGERLSGRAAPQAAEAVPRRMHGKRASCSFEMLVILAVDLLSEVVVEPDLLDDVELRFQEVDVVLFVRKNFDQ